MAQQIEQQLQSEGYRTQSKSAPLGNIVQAQKAGILRDIITADRAFTIVASGQPNDFTVHISIGKWIQNISVAAVEALLLSVLFLAVDVPEMLWTTHVEGQLVKEIQNIVGRGPPTIQNFPGLGLVSARRLNSTCSRLKSTLKTESSRRWRIMSWARFLNEGPPIKEANTPYRRRKSCLIRDSIDWKLSQTSMGRLSTSIPLNTFWNGLPGETGGSMTTFSRDERFRLKNAFVVSTG